MWLWGKSHVVRSQSNYALAFVNVELRFPVSLVTSFVSFLAETDSPPSQREIKTESAS